MSTPSPTESASQADPTAPNGAGQGTQPDLDGSNAATFTQKQVDQFVERRMSREADSRKRQIDEAGAVALQAFREEHGLDDSALGQLAEFRKKRGVEETELAQLRLVHSNKLKELEAAQDAGSAQRARLHKYLRDDRLRNAATAEGAINADQVATLLQARVRVLADDSTETLDANGEVIHGGTVADLVASYLGENEHLRTAKLEAAGGGSRGPTNGTPAGHDLTTAEGRRANFREIMTRAK